MSEKGYIYILTNPSFPEYVKIGYADDVEQRLKRLNGSSSTPFAFRCYATYEVNHRLTDMKIHDVIDKLNPNLRSIDNVNGKKRVREFYAMSPEDAYLILEAIAEINGLENNLKIWKKTEKEEQDQELSEKINELSKNRHHFKDIEFSSSLTGKKYRGTTGNDGTLKIIDLSTNEEVINNSNPSKKAIIGQAIIDLGGYTPNDESLYQRYHKLTKLTFELKKEDWFLILQ